MRSICHVLEGPILSLIYGVMLWKTIMCSKLIVWSLCSLGNLKYENSTLFFSKNEDSYLVS